MELFSVLLFAAFFVGAQCAKGAMSGHIASVVCFVTVLMTSHDVNGQTHDVAQLNRKLTIIKNSIDGDIVDIRLEIMELKMIVQQSVVGQRSASDGSIIGQGMPAGVNQNEITDLKNKLKDHENRLNRLFNTETKCEDRVNALQKHFEETLAAMMKGNTKLKAHVTVAVVNQIHNLSQTMKSEHSKLSARIDHTDANIVRLAGGVNALQNTFEETAAIQMAGYKDLETHMSVQMNNLSQSVISKQNILSARIDHADAKIVSLAGGENKLDGFSRAIGELKTRTDKCCTEVDYCAPNPCEHGTCVNGRTNYTCVCDPSHTGRNCTVFSERGKDCMEIRTLTNVSGVYRVRPAGMIKDIEVYCDMATDGGGWTVLQRRVNGSVDFYQNFASYENGFGNVHGEHWLGLKYLYAMTSTAQTELRIDLMAADSSTAYEVFSNFRLSAAPDYMLHIDPGHGTAGDSNGLSYHNGRRFVTYDRDDTRSKCTSLDRGGWWYGTCAYANLNGEYTTPGTESVYNFGEGGITYRDYKDNASLKETKMMLRRI